MAPKKKPETRAKSPARRPGRPGELAGRQCASLAQDLIARDAISVRIAILVADSFRGRGDHDEHGCFSLLVRWRATDSD